MIEEELLALVSAMAPADVNPSLDDTFGGLGYTSLRFLELSIAVECAFDLQPLTPESLSGVTRVGDLVDLVRARRDQS